MDFSLSPLWISLKTAAIATPLATLTGIQVARWMHCYRGRWRGLLDALFTLPIVLPPIVIGFLLLVFLGRNSPVGQLLDHLNIQLIFSWPALVLAATIVAFPLAYRTILSAFSQVDSNILACARTLGASESRIFWQILLPLAWPGVIAGTVLAFARALGEFGATIMVAGSIPDRTITIPIQVYLAADAGNISKASLWVCVSVLVAFSAIALLNIGAGDRTLKGARRAANIGRFIEHLFSAITRPIHKILGHSNSQHAARYSNPPSLNAQIHKHLSDFALDITLETGPTPLGILGASGSGKSLTLRCLAGLDTPDRGRLELNGRVLFDSEENINIPSRHRRIGLVFQNYALFPHMTVAENIAFGIQDLPCSQRQKQVQYHLQTLHLEGLGHRYPTQLSGGQQQRVALARALAIQPEALLFDEPLSALDNYLRHQIEQLLIDTFATYPGVVLFVTHKLEEAFRLCPRLMVLANGQPLACDRKEQIFRHPTHYQVAKITECKNFSRAKAISATAVEALDWNCKLYLEEDIPAGMEYVGIRAHHLNIFGESPPLSQTVPAANTFPCWLTRTSQMQHRITLYIKLHTPPTGSHDYHLQLELLIDRWQSLKEHSFPWYVRLSSERLMPLIS